MEKHVAKLDDEIMHEGTKEFEDQYVIMEATNGEWEKGTYYIRNKMKSEKLFRSRKILLQ